MNIIVYDSVTTFLYKSDVNLTISMCLLKFLPHSQPHYLSLTLSPRTTYLSSNLTSRKDVIIKCVERC